MADFLKIGSANFEKNVISSYIHTYIYALVLINHETQEHEQCIRDRIPTTGSPTQGTEGEAVNPVIYSTPRN